MRLGERHPLNLPVNEPAKPDTGVPAFKAAPPYKRTSFRVNARGGDGGLIINDDYIVLATQGSSHWDAMAHAGMSEPGVDGLFYNGWRTDVIDGDGATRRGGIDRFAQAGIVGRGVLLDVARIHAHGEPDPLPSDHVITPDETQACLTAQGVTVQDGDIMCFRTGWTEAYLDADREGRAALLKPSPGESFPSNPGIHSNHMAMARDQRWGAVTADNAAVEAVPTGPASQSAHVLMLRNLGLAFGEVLNFRSLAARCADDRRWEFLFVAVPFWIPGGAGSPANAIAIR